MYVPHNIYQVTIRNLSKESAEIFWNLLQENPLKMSTEVGAFLKNFQGKIIHREIPGMDTIQWQGFGRAGDYSYDYFPGIYQKQFS